MNKPPCRQFRPTIRDHPFFFSQGKNTLMRFAHLYHPSYSHPTPTDSHRWFNFSYNNDSSGRDNERISVSEPTRSCDESKVLAHAGSVHAVQINVCMASLSTTGVRSIPKFCGRSPKYRFGFRFPKRRTCFLLTAFHRSVYSPMLLLGPPSHTLMSCHDTSTTRSATRCRIP